jgi:hypothetical protein
MFQFVIQELLVIGAEGDNEERDCRHAPTQIGQHMNIEDGFVDLLVDALLPGIVFKQADAEDSYSGPYL